MRGESGTRTLIGIAFAVLCLPTTTLTAQEPGSDSSTESGRPEPKVTPAVRSHIFDRMIEAQTCLDEGDTECALGVLEELGQDRNLNAYERANLLGLYAVTYFDLNDYESAAGSYEALLALPRAELPDSIIQAAMKNLASTYWNLERPADALAMLDQWFALPSTTPAASDWYLKGTMHYQIEEFAEGVAAVRRAIGLANDKGDRGEEGWYQLLAAMYDELGETDLVIETLTILVENWTRRQNVLQLAGQLQQAGRNEQMLVLFEAAYGMGWLRTSNELMALASMHLQADTPFKAAQVLAQGLADGTIEATERSWNMLAQSWQYAGNHDLAIPAFERASALSDTGDIDVRLAHSQSRLARYEDCIATLEQALERGVDGPDRAYLLLGHCHYSLKQWDEADRAFADAEKTERSRQTARDYRARVLSRRNTEEEYARQLAEALADLEDDPADQ